MKPAEQCCRGGLWIVLLLVAATARGQSLPGEDRCQAAADGCDRVCSGCETDGCAAEAWQPLDVAGQRLGLDLGGWVMAGFTANAHGNRTGIGNSPLGFNNVADGPVLHALWLYAEQPLDSQCCGWDWGFRIDYLFGADAPDNQAFGDGGWDFGWNSSRDYGSSIPQLYVSAGINELSVKLGHFFTIVGWETSIRPDNFFYSHTYQFYYGESNTHTGVLANWSPGDRLELYGGWVTGWDGGFGNPLGASMFKGGARATLLEGATVTWIVTAGDFGDGSGENGTPGNAGSLYFNSIVLSLKLNERWDYLLWHDLGDNRGLGAGNNQWHGIVQYLTCQLNACWSVGARYEWFHDDDGVRVVNNSGAGAGDYHAWTLAANWKPRANVIVRPELRWDWFRGDGQPFDPRGGVGTSDRMFTGGTAVVVTF